MDIRVDLTQESIHKREPKWSSLEGWYWHHEQPFKWGWNNLSVKLKVVLVWGAKLENYGAVMEIGPIN